MELGEVATPFEHRSFGDELARCQRYLETIHRLRGGVDGAGSTQRAGTLFQTTKRATPTITGTIYDSVSDVDENGFSIQRSGNPADMSAGALADAEL